MALSQRPIAALSFDLDDTLWDVWPIIRRAEQKMLDHLAQRHPRMLSRFPPQRLRELMGEVVREHPELAHDFSRLRHESLARAAERSGYDRAVAEAAFEVFYEARNDIEPFPEAEPTLAALARRHPLVSITNGNADVARIPLGRFFRANITAAAVGRPKPFAEIFLAACEAVGAAPREVVHIGDDPDLDIIGAKQAGMRAIWFNPGADPWPGGPAPDVEIRRLTDLIGLLS